MKRMISRFAPVLAFAAMLVAAGSASAAVTSSQVTTPADGTHLLENQYNVTADQFHFAGTSAGGQTGIDTVDVRCYYDGTYTTVANAVAIGADGSFSGDANVSTLGKDACVLRAVPSGTGGDSLSAFTGPRLAPTQIRQANKFTDVSQNNGIYDYYLRTAGFAAFADFESWASCGLDDSFAYPPGTSFEDPSNYMFYCNAYAYYRGDGQTPGSVVDGHNSYSADGVERFAGQGTVLKVGTGGSAAPVRSLGYTPNWDPITGNVTIQESDPLMRCQKSDNSDYDAIVPTTGATTCDHLADVGVTVNRTITTSNDGQTVKIADDYTSTDSAAHTISLLMEQDFDGDPLFKFPGDSDYIGRSDYESVASPAAVPATIYVRNNRTSSSNTQPIPQFGAITTPNAWDSADFYGNDGFYLVYRNRQIPAGGSLHLEWVYNTTYFEPGQVSLARSAEDGYAGPSVSITAPANGSTSATSPVTVTGKATDNVAVTSLTVNGAAVTPAADGSFSVPVALPAKGANTITAIAKDGAGNSSQAQITLVYAPPAATCKVPNVKRKTLTAAKKAIKKAGCTVGKVRSKKSTKVKPGRVISQSVKAGRVVKAGTKVGLTVSKKGKVSKKK